MKTLALILIPSLCLAADYPSYPTAAVRPYAPVQAKVQPVVRDAPSRAHWTHPGNIVDHLIKEHGYSYSQLVGKTEDQLRTLHDQAHEGVRAAPQAQRQVQYQYQQSYSSSCPGGVCPTSRRERRFLQRFFGR